MPNAENDAPRGFTVEEATKTHAGDIRAVILWEIASRCGQVPDVHPRLLEGIEAAARILAARVTPPAPTDQEEIK